MTEIEMKYGFPLFTKNQNTVYLGNHKKLIISDIWSFWDYIIKKNSKNKPFLNSLLEQAKNFYQSAEQSPVKSKPLLYYYSFLNLSKIILSLENGYTSNFTYMHGLKEINNGKFSLSEIKIQEKKIQIKNVAYELMEVFGDDLPDCSFNVNIKEMLAHCVGIHRAYSEIYNNQKEIFLRLEKPSLYKDGKDMIFKSKINSCKNDDYQKLIALNYPIIQEENEYFINITIQTANYHKVRNDYYNLSKELKKFGIWYFIGNKGYTMYLSTNPDHRYSIESIIYNTMFYLGSITRYHPHLFDKIFSDKEQWLMSEFLETQPKQFLYLATAKILGQNVLKAYTSF